MSTTTVDYAQIQPLDALWALFKSQPKAIRKAFVKRMLQEDVEAEALRQQMVVKKSLNQAFKELDEVTDMESELPNVRSLFN